jgi:hypothetical protein
MRRHHCRRFPSSTCTVASRLTLLQTCLDRPCRRITATTAKATLWMRLISTYLRHRAPYRSHQSRTMSKCLCSSLSITIVPVRRSSLRPRRCNTLGSVHPYRQCLSSISSSSIININTSSNRCMAHNAQYTLRTRIPCSLNTVVDLRRTRIWDRPLTTSFTMLHVLQDSFRSALTLL